MPDNNHLFPPDARMLPHIQPWTPPCPSNNDTHHSLSLKQSTTTHFHAPSMYPQMYVDPEPSMAQPSSTSVPPMGMPNTCFFGGAVE